MSIQRIKIIFIFVSLGGLLALATSIYRGLASDKTESLSHADTDSKETETRAEIPLIREILVHRNTQNMGKINGLWAMVENYTIDHGTGAKNNLQLPTRKENQFYIQLRRPSTVWMTQLTQEKESDIEYSISSLSTERISIFRQISNDNTIQVYQLRLIQRDIDDYATQKNGNKGGQKEPEGQIVLELKEVYDLKSQRIINVNSRGYEISGLMEFERGTATSVSASINGLELNPATLTKVGKDDYDYSVENNRGEMIVGKAQATFINTNELNFYFISGAYRGYTLIFARKLSDDEIYEKENLRVELMDRRLSRGHNELNPDDDENMLTEEERGERASKAQRKALAKRQRLHQRGRKGRRKRGGQPRLHSDES